MNATGSTDLTSKRGEFRAITKMATIKATKKALADSVERYRKQTENLSRALELCRSGGPIGKIRKSLEDVSFSMYDCALCRLFNPRHDGSENSSSENSCKGCPVQLFTGEPFCNGSPFEPRDSSGVGVRSDALEDTLAMPDQAQDMEGLTDAIERLLESVKEEHEFLAALEVEED